MPKRKDIQSILIIGAGPIIIGQACEFDYSGTQACTALKEEGYRIILVNSNPATIMTDKNLADATYLEPINKNSLTAIIKKEKPDAILPTVGGQTGLDAAIELFKSGILDEYDVELIGANVDAIESAENREHFKDRMDKAGIKTAKGGFVNSYEEIKDKYNKEFYRMWTFWLLSSAANFRARTLQLWQVLFSLEGSERPIKTYR